MEISGSRSSGVTSPGSLQRELLQNSLCPLRGAGLGESLPDRTAICGSLTTAQTKSAGSLLLEPSSSLRLLFLALGGSRWDQTALSWATASGSLSGTSVGRITPAGVTTIFQSPTIASGGEITTGSDGNLWFTESGNVFAN